MLSWYLHFSIDHAYRIYRRYSADFITFISLQRRRMSVVASQITADSTVCSINCLGHQQRKDQTSALLSLYELLISMPWLHHIYHLWIHFPRYWPFVREIHQSLVNSPHKGQWRGALMFSLISVWINGWVNNRKAGDLRRHRAHYDVIVMFITFITCRVFLWRWRAAFWEPPQIYL